MGQLNAMRVGELIKRLKQCDQNAQVEFEVPERCLADDPEDIYGARVIVDNIEETFYNDPDNKWVTLK